MAHTLLFAAGRERPGGPPPARRLQLVGRDALDEGLRALTAVLRPWTIDFHVAQNDATVFGSGSHDRTGRHCLPDDPNGKLDIPHHAGFWLRDDCGRPTQALRHICWDGCMFPNAVLLRPETWNAVLATMIAVRDVARLERVTGKCSGPRGRHSGTSGFGPCSMSDGTSCSCSRHRRICERRSSLILARVDPPHRLALGRGPTRRCPRINQRGAGHQECRRTG